VSPELADEELGVKPILNAGSPRLRTWVAPCESIAGLGRRFRMVFRLTDALFFLRNIGMCP